MMSDSSFSLVRAYESPSDSTSNSDISDSSTCFKEKTTFKEKTSESRGQVPRTDVSYQAVVSMMGGGRNIRGRIGKRQEQGSVWDTRIATTKGFGVQFSLNIKEQQVSIVKGTWVFEVVE
ncbi:hypothetical protein Tco_1060902, partial [Tanacetum coccineum]